MFEPTIKFQCERHSGKSMYVWTEERILDPKDMRRCFVEACDTKQRCTAKGHHSDKEEISGRERAQEKSRGGEQQCLCWPARNSALLERSLGR